MHARLLQLGRHLSSRERARHLREEVLRYVQNPEKITVDLSGVRSVSDSFADEFFAVLVVQHGERWFREHILVIDALPEVRAAIIRAIRARLGEIGSSHDEGLAPPPEDLPPAYY
jgi:hypothetical protein